jgi:hypothetical protein
LKHRKDAEKHLEKQKTAESSDGVGGHRVYLITIDLYYLFEETICHLSLKFKRFHTNGVDVPRGKKAQKAYISEERKKRGEDEN